MAAVSRHAPHAMAALLAVLFAVLSWKSLVSLHTTESPAHPAAAAQSRSVSRQISTDHIANAHLFGVAETAGASQAAAPPPSSWHVIGIIVSDSPQESLADVVVDGAEHLWHVGDRLPDGSMLAAINSDGIKTTGGTAVLPFELGPASFDNRSLQTDADNDNLIDAIAAAPTAHPETAPGLPDRMTALRTAGVAVWLKRIRQPSHRTPAKPTPQ